MKTTLCLLFTVLAAMLVAVKPAVANDSIPFIGEWSVDFDRTMEESKHSPKYSPEMAERMPAMIKRMMETMRIRFTAAEVVYVIRGKEQAYPYTVVKADASGAVLQTRLNEKDFTLTVRLIDGALMNFRSSGTDDMDYYIWKRVPSGE